MVDGMYTYKLIKNSNPFAVTFEKYRLCTQEVQNSLEFVEVYFSVLFFFVDIFLCFFFNFQNFYNPVLFAPLSNPFDTKKKVLFSFILKTKNNVLDDGV